MAAAGISGQLSLADGIDVGTFFQMAVDINCQRQRCMQGKQNTMAGSEKRTRTLKGKESDRKRSTMDEKYASIKTSGNLNDAGNCRTSNSSLQASVTLVAG
ncbi:hypothetical protein TWF694_004942 [Orbilia ellipsospora]|uniref:Uncharacterized protein n=1 Tax=Orbilia ellipsospora TaxID=2528407 RepID=A0AAV9WU65_9PEZI